MVKEKLEKIKGIPNMGEPLRNEDGTITVKAVSYSNGKNSCVIKFAIS